MLFCKNKLVITLILYKTQILSGEYSEISNILLYNISVLNSFLYNSYTIRIDYPKICINFHWGLIYYRRLKIQISRHNSRQKTTNLCFLYYQICIANIYLQYLTIKSLTLMLLLVHKYNVKFKKKRKKKIETHGMINNKNLLCSK